MGTTVTLGKKKKARVSMEAPEQLGNAVTLQLLESKDWLSTLCHFQKLAFRLIKGSRYHYGICKSL